MNIRCFSGMGNSAAVATRLAEKLPEGFADVVYVCPVYSWGLPPIIVRHLENATDLAGRRVHLVVTCGDDTGNIDRQWQRLLRERGALAGSIYSVQMPNTYVNLPFMDVDSAAVANEKLARAAGRVDAIATRLASGIIETDIHRGALPGLKSSVIYPLFFADLPRIARKFHSTASCTGCGICVRQCPNSNITLDSDRRPCWGNNCTYCLRCYHVCPTHSVAYGRRTSKKGQYLHPEYQSVIKNFKNF
ncbi:MAG: 4Fe-4S binding protein [Bacteroidales bacterium]|nr:4Fe-4S binding protein [Bacteroidales bacterium]